jgi:ribosomal protein S12 methylthiotransferase
VKFRRRDIVMEEQRRSSDAYNEAQIGKTVTVLTESFDRYAECWFGRTEGDAPDIDGKVFFTATRPVQPGDMVEVTVIDTMDWDLIGEMI